MTKYTLHYRRGHRAGYTDDLGIIADVNQWVGEQLAGWYCFLPYHFDHTELKAWIHENLKDYWYIEDNTLYISSEADSTFFKLTWC